MRFHAWVFTFALSCAAIGWSQITPPMDGGSFATCTSGSPFDRYYQFGDDSGENGAPGSLVGVNVAGSFVTFDSIGTSGSGDFNDLTVMGNPVYVNTNSMPFGGGVGIAFDGSDYLVGESLNWPQVTRSSTAYLDDDTNPLPGPCNYSGVVNRAFQFWVRPDNAGLGNGMAQSLLVDSNQHGVLISENDTWVLRYNNEDIDSGVAVNGGEWQHVQVARPFGASGPTGGARLWVDGVAIAAASGDYASSRVDLVVGANTANDENGNFTGGTEDFFIGDMDRLFFTVHGDNSADAGPPPGQNYGSFDFATQNDFATANISSIGGDLNSDGVFDAADRQAFIAGWMEENLVNDLRAGDIMTIANGDINFDGITNLSDLVLYQQELVAAGLEPIDPSELVPEPSSISLFALVSIGLLPLLRRRSRLV